MTGAPSTAAEERFARELNRLCKWRSVLTGRILGTRPDTDPPTQGFRDVFEKLLILRVEVTALVRALTVAGVLDLDAFVTAAADEAALLEADYQQRFPGFKATDLGLEIDAERAVETTQGWPA